MSEPCCENCKHWSMKEENLRGYRVCLRWMFSYGNEVVPYKGDGEGSPIFTPVAFGCNFFEEKLKGPFSVSKCCGDQHKRWMILADFDELFSVKSRDDSCSTTMTRVPGRAISGGLYKEDAKEIAEWLNEHWLKHENPKGS